MSESQATGGPADLNSLVNAEAWTDPQFKSELESDPQGAMARFAAKHGLELPEGVQYQVVSNTEQVQNIVLWPVPAEVSPAEVASEVQGYADQFAAQIQGGPSFGGSTTSYVCTAIYTTCSHWCPSKRLAPKP